MKGRTALALAVLLVLGLGTLASGEAFDAKALSLGEDGVAGSLLYKEACAGTPVTVETTVAIPDTSSLPAEIWLVALATKLSDSPEGITLRWQLEGTGWMPAWQLQLAAPQGMLPRGNVDGQDGSLEFINLQVRRFGVEGLYQAVISYDPDTGRLSVALLDIDDASEIFSTSLVVKPSSQALYPAAGWLGSEEAWAGEDAEAKGGFRVQAMEVEAGFQAFGLPWTLKRSFAWKAVNLATGKTIGPEVFSDEKLAIDLDWQGLLGPGDIRISLTAGEGKGPIWADGTRAGKTVHLPNLQDLPAGEITLRLDYVEDDREYPIGERSFFVIANRIRVDWSLYGRNYFKEPGKEHLPLEADPGISGRAIIRSERPLKDYPLRLEARFVPSEIQSTRDGCEIVKKVELVHVIPILTTMVNVPAETPFEIPFQFAIPPDEGVVEVEAMPGDSAAVSASLVGAETENRVFPAPLIPGFPGAEGFGAYTPGGRGGRVYVVMNLNDSGPGSLREAVEATGPRIVTFGVSGTIRLKSALNIRNPYITIAGQTAPGDGITVADFPVVVSGHDVIVRHIRFRLGDKGGQQEDSFSVVDARNVLIDHVSASWSVDETLSVSDSYDVTVQWSLITESLNNSIHEKGSHGYGSLLRGTNGSKYSFHHNLWAHHRGRSPRPGNYFSYTEDPVGLLGDFRNNVFYNWGGSYAGYNSDTESISNYNFINNYYLRGPNSSASAAFRESCSYARAYFAGNYMNGAEPGDPWQLVTGTTDGQYRQAQPLPTAFVTTTTAPEAYEAVLAEAGTMPRDAVDARVIESVRNRSGRIIDSQADVGGWPELKMDPQLARDSSGNGMPDWWQIKYGFKPGEWLDPAGDIDGDGYTNIEEYLNGTHPIGGS